MTKPLRIKQNDIRRKNIQSFKQLFEYSNKIPYWLISYNDKSYPTKDVLIDLIKQIEMLKSLIKCIIIVSAVRVVQKVVGNFYLFVNRKEVMCNVQLL